jgi:hypothetical protein
MTRTPKLSSQPSLDFPVPCNWGRGYFAGPLIILSAAKVIHGYYRVSLKVKRNQRTFSHVDFMQNDKWPHVC